MLPPPNGVLSNKPYGFFLLYPQLFLLFAVAIVLGEGVVVHLEETWHAEHTLFFLMLAIVV